MCGLRIVAHGGAESARDVAPDDVAPAWTPLPPFLDHALLLGRHEIEHGVAAHAHETMRRQQRLDLLPRPAPQERELITDRRVLRARAGILRRWGRGAGVELSVHDDEAPTRPENADPLVDRRLRVLERPQHVPADHEVEGARRERELSASVASKRMETPRSPALRRASASIAGAKSTPVT
jgi:hypothetical protein